MDPQEKPLLGTRLARPQLSIYISINYVSHREFDNRDTSIYHFFSS